MNQERSGRARWAWLGAVLLLMPVPAYAIGGVCGDGLQTVGEQCDDGNGVSGDGCSSGCLVEQPDWVCRDPRFTFDEVAFSAASDAVVEGSFEDRRGRPSDAWPLTINNPFLPANLICSEATCTEGESFAASVGAFAAVLRSDLGEFFPQIGQSITLPDQAAILTFDLWVKNCASPNHGLYAAIDGETVFSMACANSTSGFMTQTVDISALANNQTRDLVFYADVLSGGLGVTEFVIDSVQIPLDVPSQPVAGECWQLEQSCEPVETFDTGIPADWTLISGGDDPTIGWGVTDDALCLSRNAAQTLQEVLFSDGNNLTSGTGVALCIDSDATGQNAEDTLPGSAPLMDAYACSNAIDLSTVTGPALTFTTFYQAAQNNLIDDNGTPEDESDDFDPEFLRVVAGTEPPTSESLPAYELLHEVQDHDDSVLARTGAQEVSVDLSGILEAESQAYVCFHYRGRFAGVAQVDNVAFRGQSCDTPPLDSDGDGIFDSVDNCTLVPNPDQIDTNTDGIGNRCDPDIDNNCIVAFLDISSFPPSFNSAAGDPNYDEDKDLDSNGTINFLDYIPMIERFGQPPGPSANPCIPGLGFSATPSR
ncbi:MAG: hypothetical protein AAF465_09170 [Pseudomonadota bacterium]